MNLALVSPAAEMDMPLAFDADGYLAEPLLWNRRVAEAIGRAEGLSVLTNKHWEVIDHVRGKYFELGALPVMRLVCRANGLDRHKAHELFGSCKSLWRIAGLPHPGAEAHAYMQ